MPLNERIKALRTGRGMSQAEFAAWLDVSQASVSLMEQGKPVGAGVYLSVMARFPDNEELRAEVYAAKARLPEIEATERAAQQEVVR